MEIREDDLSSTEIATFLAEHLEEMHRVTPPESVHALDLEGLRSPQVTFWSVRKSDRLLGCGALQEIGPGLGEIKSMRTDPSHRGAGIGTRMLKHIMDEATRRGYESLSLETGAMDDFAPARALYERHGFERCGPFNGYTDDPNSVFMTRRL
jgi:putative acetyltransferase